VLDGEERMQQPALPPRKVPLVDRHAVGFDGDPAREETFSRSTTAAR
jgi:hypothetical protein